MHAKQGGEHPEAQECAGTVLMATRAQNPANPGLVLASACSSGILGRFPPLSGLQFPDPKGALTPAPMERRTWRCPVLGRNSEVPAQAWPVSRKDCSGCGCEAGGAHDRFSLPGPHSALMPGLVLSPPTAPVCPTGRAPRLARRPQTAGTPHRSRSQRTPPLRAPQRCQPPRTGGLGRRAHRARLGGVGLIFPIPAWAGMPGASALPHQGAGRPGHSLRSSLDTHPPLLCNTLVPGHSWSDNQCNITQ